MAENDVKVGYIKNSIKTRELDPAIQKKLAECMQSCKCKEHEPLFKIGTPCDATYFVVSGKWVAYSAEGKPLISVTKGQIAINGLDGDSGATNPFTVAAISQTSTAWKLKYVDYARVLKEAQLAKEKEEVSSAMRAEMLACVKNVPLWLHWQQDEAFTGGIVDHLRHRSYPAGAPIFKKGDIRREMYFVGRGEVNVIGDAGNVILTMGQGSFFGEIALIDDAPKPDAIVALTPCEIFVLSTDDFEKVVAEFPGAAGVMRGVILQRMQMSRAR